MRLVTQLLAGLTLSGLALASAAAKECVHPEMRFGCHATIQGAVDAASVGDTIKVFPGVYHETVDVAKDDLTIKGVSLGGVFRQGGTPQANTRGTFGNLLGNALDEVIIEGEIPATVGDPPMDGDVIEVNADGVTLRNLTVRNANADSQDGNGIIVDGEKAHIDGVTVRKTDDDCIDINGGGDGSVVEESHVSGCEDDGIDVDGADDVIVRDNRVHDVEDDGIDGGFGSDGLRVVDNEVSNSDDDCVDIDGDDGRVEDNTLQRCEEDGVDYDGDDGQIVRNTIRLAEDGVDVDGSQVKTSRNQISGVADDGIDYYDSEDPVITHNTVNGAEDELIEVDCEDSCDGEVAHNRVSGSYDDEGYDIYADVPGLKVHDNRARQTVEEGFEISGEDVVLRNNVARDVGGDSGAEGFDIYGEDHELYDNVARNGGEDGFDIEGYGHRLEGNRATNNLEDGFDVNDTGTEDVQLVDNVATDNGGVGIEVSEDVEDTQVEMNRAHDNGVDFCDEGTNTMTMNNDFGTTSATCYVE